MALTIALAQLNPTVGDVAGNLARVRHARDRAAELGADLVVLSELVLVGYPPEDLVLRPALVDAAAAALHELERDTASGGPAVIVTLPWRIDGCLHNAAALVTGGRSELRFKHELPNYGVFDEKRVFNPGPLPEPITFRGIRLGIPICEDIWLPSVTAHLAGAGVELLLVPNGSPFEVDKFDERLELARARTSEAGAPLAYVNQVGGQDELVFDGGSFVMNADGTLAHRLPFWREAIVITTWEKSSSGLRCVGTPAGHVRSASAEATADRRSSNSEGRSDEPWQEPPRLETIYSAMMLGLRDYVRKNGFKGIVLGLSGGIDSALTAAVAVDALGAERVRGVRLPSRFTSQASMDDAADSAASLGITLETISIAQTVDAAEAALTPPFGSRERDVTEENLQARVRGLLLMGMSNKFGELLVTTGNKSEMSVGYATLYGDMCGGYSVLKDIYKTEVYALAEWRNTHVPEDSAISANDVIPESSITKAPTAELRPNQTDQDSLPPYDVLDAILHGLIEEEQSVDQIVAGGFDRATVSRVQRLLYSAEYKRRQAPPGVKITRKSFGRDRRYPMTNAFRQ
ncbi:MAG TPA: NAD+ synthase [Vicinamibacterales bacterium]|nr:NAD+ synthase [Vicinamibacterales bacterium]